MTPQAVAEQKRLSEIESQEIRWTGRIWKIFQTVSGLKLKRQIDPNV